ncbi:MAG: TetR/AcrR family transcriptional regulator [bacterium]|nr:TetR/AcrR family transcriptional regulator [bacterium]
MARTLKNHDTRLNNLLDIVQTLFMEKGYENATISDVLERAGIAKGTLYHYFKSKEDMLDRLIDRLSKRIMERMDAIMKQPGINAIERLNLLLRENRSIKIGQGALLAFILKTLYSDSNIVLRHKLARKTAELQVPLFSEIIAQGNREGLFHVGNVGETAVLLAEMIIGFSEPLIPLFLDLPRKKENAGIIRRSYGAMTEAVIRILGAAPSSIVLVDDADTSRFIDLFSRKAQE